MILAVAPDAPMFQGVVYEFSAIALSIVTAIHCYTKRGKWDTIRIFGVGMLYGLVLENGGPMHLPAFGFNGYFYEENYKLYLFEFFGHGKRLSLVPLCTHTGWPVVFYTAVLFWERIGSAFPSVRGRVWLSSLIITFSGLLFDLNFDIQATRFNWWVWHERYLPLWFGVPLINYIAWFWAVVVFGWVWVWLRNKPHLTERQFTLYLLASLPLLWLIALIGVTATQWLVDAGGLLYVSGS
jgi:hypothetical protein